LIDRREFFGSPAVGLGSLMKLEQIFSNGNALAMVAAFVNSQTLHEKSIARQGPLSSAGRE
jgi:hypothetical protein